MQLFKSKIKDIIMVVIFATMLILGTKFDFRFSDKIYTDNNWLNFFVAAIAKMPAFFVTMYACVSLFVLSLKKENKVDKILSCFIYCVGALFAGTLMFEDMVEVFLDGIFKYLVALAVGALLIGYLFYTLKDVEKEKIEIYKKEYMSLLIAVAIIVIFTFAIKEVIDRTRFADVLVRKGSFTNWYEIGTGGDSMPSGHTAMACALFAMIPYFKKLDLFKGKNYLYYPVIGLYTLLVALSRISFGMHYLSDVAVAGIMAFVVSKVVTWIVLGFSEDKLEIKEGSLLSRL